MHICIFRKHMIQCSILNLEVIYLSLTVIFKNRIPSWFVTFSNHVPRWIKRRNSCKKSWTHCTIIWRTACTFYRWVWKKRSTWKRTRSACKGNGGWKKQRPDENRWYSTNYSDTKLWRRKNSNGTNVAWRKNSFYHISRILLARVSFGW